MASRKKRRELTVEVPVDHQAGQLKAELFEELLSRLAEKIFPGAKVSRNYILRRKNSNGIETPTSVDLLVEEESSQAVVIECKVPYTSTPSYGINRTIWHIKDVIPRLQKHHNIGKAVLAVGAELPASTLKEVEQAKSFFHSKGIEFEVWDSRKIHSLTQNYLGARVPEFSIDNLKRILGKVSGEKAHKQTGAPRAVPEPDAIGKSSFPPGEHDKVVVLCADFCSYSKFVHASGNDRDLVISIMGRFYRETRNAIASARGSVDKFMGDGVLAFWRLENKDDKVWLQLDKCLTELIGISLNLATEWQDQIDLAVTPKGLRAGAAFGNILMISETTQHASPIHAIGECINIAARLQGEARPNTLLLSNKLKSVFSDGAKVFKKLDTKALKNIGEAIVWERDYGTGA